MRYEAMFGPNTKQWWLYDSETDEYCDPPIRILNLIDEMPSETADDVALQTARLEEIANGLNDWIDNACYRYRDIEI